MLKPSATRSAAAIAAAMTNFLVRADRESEAGGSLSATAPSWMTLLFYVRVEASSAIAVSRKIAV